MPHGGGRAALGDVERRLGAAGAQTKEQPDDLVSVLQAPSVAQPWRGQAGDG